MCLVVGLLVGLYSVASRCATAKQTLKAFAEYIANVVSLKLENVDVPYKNPAPQYVMKRARYDPSVEVGSRSFRYDEDFVDTVLYTKMSSGHMDPQRAASNLP